MNTTIRFTLEKPARKSGGDKYVASDHEDFSIYVPQKISRTAGEPAKKLLITISSETTAVEV